MASDIHAFAITIWQTYTCKTPYWKESKELQTAISKLITDGVRPSLDDVESSSLQNLLKSCWSPDASQRLGVLVVMQMLEEELKSVDKDSNPEPL